MMQAFEYLHDWFIENSIDPRDVMIVVVSPEARRIEHAIKHEHRSVNFNPMHETPIESMLGMKLKIEQKWPTWSTKCVDCGVDTLLNVNPGGIRTRKVVIGHVCYTCMRGDDDRGR